MRPVLATLALVAVAACTPPPAAAPSSAGHGGAFDGCSAMFTSVLGWTLTCDGTTLLTREGDDPEALLRGARESMRSSFGGPVEERRDDVQITGRARKGLELSLRTSAKELVGQGLAAVLEGDGGPSRLVACLAGADDASLARCRQQLENLSSVPYAEMPPAGVRIQPRPAPAIAERPVTAPPDCHLAANDRTGLLDCGDAVLGWSEPSDSKSIPAQRDATVEDMRLRMRVASTQPPKQSSAACHIEGVAAKCSRIQWPAITLTIGSAAVRGHTILVWCVTREGQTSRICDDAISVAASSAPPRGK